MKKFIKILFLGFIMNANVGNVNAEVSSADLENMIYLDVSYGRVVIELYPEVAPNHVKRIKELVRDGFYDGLKFHRVIPGFMAQTGDPLGNGTGGSGRNLKQEFSELRHDRGIVSMARASDPDSADSQFFIVYSKAYHLDGKYTIWGNVISGMEHVDKIKQGNISNNGVVKNPDIIVKMMVAADEAKKSKSK